MRKFICSFDDGTFDDLRMAELLKKYKIPAIFYIPNNCELTDDDIVDLSKDFEIGGHSVSHFSDMKLLDGKTLVSEIQDNKDWLENIIGRKITSFCFPRGRYNEQVKEAVKNAGYREARTTKVLNTEIPKDKFEIATTVHFSYPRDEYKGRDQFELAKWYVDGYAGGHFHYLNLWAHSKECSRFSYWDKIEDLFLYINNKRGGMKGDRGFNSRVSPSS